MKIQVYPFNTDYYSVIPRVGFTSYRSPTRRLLRKPQRTHHTAPCPNSTNWHLEIGASNDGSYLTSRYLSLHGAGKSKEVSTCWTKALETMSESCGWCTRGKNVTIKALAQ